MYRTLARLHRWGDCNSRVVIAVAFAFGVLCFGPWVALHLGHLWERQHYQFFPMLMISLAAIAVSRRSSIPKLVPDGKAPVHDWKISVPLLCLLLMSLGVAVWLNSPWFGTIGCVTLLLLVARNFGDLYPTIWPLLLLIPLPFALDTNLIAWLQRVSSIGASALLDMVDIRHLMSGNVLEFPDRKLFVEEACSGIGSAFLLLATAAVYAVWRRMRTIMAIPLLISGVVWAVAGNTFRIFIVAFSEAKHGPDFSHGLAHDFLGTATYCFSILMLVLTEQALQFVFEPIAEQQSCGNWIVNYGDSVRTSLIHFWNWRTSCEANFLKERSNSRGVAGIAVSPVMFLVALIPILATFSVVTGLRFWPQSFAEPVTQAAQALPQPVNPKLESIPTEVFSKSTAVPQLVDCTTETRTNISGQLRHSAHLKTWQLKLAGVNVTASVEGCFDAWNDARTEFQNNGWKILRSEVVPSPGIGDESTVVVWTEFYHSNGERILLMFGEFNNRGGPIPVPANTDLLSTPSGFNEQGTDAKEATWQFQMVIPHSQEIDSPTRTYWSQTYLEMFEIILDRWKSQL